MLIEETSSYKRYINMVKEGLLLVPDKILESICNKITSIYKEKPLMMTGEVHEVELNAKKVSITSRGSLRDVAIDGIHFDSIEQAACNIYDPYDESYELSDELRLNPLDYTFIPIIDTSLDQIRYTISKYSKGLRKYFDPHKVVKAVYSSSGILFYVKDKNDVLKKYFFKIYTLNMNDLMPAICKAAASQNGLDSDLYLAFFVHEEELPFSVGAGKEDFYALKDILNKISFKGTTPLKYMLFKELSGKEVKCLKTKQAILFDIAMNLQNKSKKQLCDQLKITVEEYDSFISSDLPSIKSSKNKDIDRLKIGKLLNRVDNFFELKYYEKLNLIWKVKFDDIPGKI